MDPGYGNGLPLNVTSLNSNSLVLEVTNMDPKLFVAVTLGNIKLLETLVEQNVNILQQVTPKKDTSIHIAAGLGHLEIVRRIHNRCPTLLTKANLMGDTALHRAARAGHSDIVSFLIDCAKKSRSSSGRDVEFGRAEAINLMRKENREKNTVMHEAVRSSDLEMVKLLIKEDPELLLIENYAKQSPLYLAVEKNLKIAVEKILETDHYSYKGPNGLTALHAAIIHRRQGITKMLLEKKSELMKEADDNGRIPLHFASGLGFLKSVQMLLKHNTSTTYFLDKTGSAPVHYSAHLGRLDIIKKFIRVQPDLKDLLDRRGRNMLHIAIECNKVDVVKYILNQKGLRGLSNEKDNDGNTPLHQAAIISNPYIVSILLKDKSVDVMAFNRNQHTALEVAKSRFDESMENEKAQAKVLVIANLLLAGSALGSTHQRIHREMNKYKLKSKQESLETCKGRVNTLLVVATLVATVTFTAGFTLPGGYQSGGPNAGMATLQNLRPFHEFIFF